MRVDELPDLVLHRICMKLEAEDIKSLHHTNQKFFNYIRANRLHFKKHEVVEMEILLRDNGQRVVEVLRTHGPLDFPKASEGKVEDVVKWFDPERLVSYDHDELVNMNQLWWREKTHIQLNDVIDYRRYLPHFDRCTAIFLKSDNPMNLSEILASMETKHLVMFSVSGNGKLECTVDDLQKIARLSRKMRFLHLENFSDSSNISNDDILDMIEIASFSSYAIVDVSTLQDNLLQCLGRRDWVVKSMQKCLTSFSTKLTNGSILRIQKAKSINMSTLRPILDKLGEWANDVWTANMHFKNIPHLGEL